MTRKELDEKLRKIYDKLIDHDHGVDRDYAAYEKVRKGGNAPQPQ